jgi:hypothetical protein
VTDFWHPTRGSRGWSHGSREGGSAPADPSRRARTRADGQYLLPLTGLRRSTTSQTTRPRQTRSAVYYLLFIALDEEEVVDSPTPTSQEKP